MTEQFSSLFQSLYADNRGRVYAYDDRSSEFTRRSDVYQGSTYLLFLYNFVIMVVVEIALFACDNNGNDMFPDKKLSDFQFANDVAPLR